MEILLMAEQLDSDVIDLVGAGDYFFDQIYSLLIP